MHDKVLNMHPLTPVKLRTVSECKTLWLVQITSSPLASSSTVSLKKTKTYVSLSLSAVIWCSP